jgi:hypothetical protein
MEAGCTDYLGFCFAKTYSSKMAWMYKLQSGVVQSISLQHSPEGAEAIFEQRKG